MDFILSQSAGTNGQDISAICLGSGRFLRSVLVPFLSNSNSNSKPAVFQTRGRTFLDSFHTDTGDHDHDDCGNNEDNGGTTDGTNNVMMMPSSSSLSLHYEMDTIEFNGDTTTSTIEIYAAGTLGTVNGKSQLMDELLPNTKGISVIGVGVTESGLESADTQCMLDLTQLLYKLFEHQQSRTKKCIATATYNPNANNGKKICVINTDNVPNNGNVIRGHVLKNAMEHYVDDDDDKPFVEFLNSKVAFLNSMVDRITSSRPNSKNGLVPLCEPLPKKALVICDEGRDLPSWMNDEHVQSRFGVKIRHDPKELESDIALKLRVANGTHTAVAHAMALLSLVNTEALSCSSSSSSSSNTIIIVNNYLDSLYETQILPGAVNDGISLSETNASWEDWRQRLRHPHFGLSTFFITQNGAAKCGIRLGPTIKSLILANNNDLSVSMVFAVAVILRFLTPASSTNAAANHLCQRRMEGAKQEQQRGVYLGWLDFVDGDSSSDTTTTTTVTYADGLRYNLSEGWYEFKCNCPIRATLSDDMMTLPEALSKLDARNQLRECKEVVRSYLLHPLGGDLHALLLEGENVEENTRRKVDTFVDAVSTLYARMVGGGDGSGISVLLREMAENRHVYINGFATSCACLTQEE